MTFFLKRFFIHCTLFFNLTFVINFFLNFEFSLQKGQFRPQQLFFELSEKLEPSKKMSEFLKPQNIGILGACLCVGTQPVLRFPWFCFIVSMGFISATAYILFVVFFWIFCVINSNKSVNLAPHIHCYYMIIQKTVIVYVLIT